MKTIYYFGSLRRDKVIPALKQYYDVTDVLYAKENLRLAIGSVWKRPPSLLIIDTPHIVSGILAWIATRKKIPYIIRQRGGLWRETNDKTNQNYLRKVVQFRIRDRILKKSNAIITVSKFVRVQVKGRICNNQLPYVATIPNIVQPEKGSGQVFRKKFGIPPNSKIILTITSFSTFKKYRALLDYAGSIIDILIKNENWCWIILGGGYAIGKIENELYQKAPNLLDGKRVLFGGHYEPIWDAYDATQIVVQMSYRESMGNPLLEAQSVGKVAICNKHGGMPELIRGNLVYRNPNELWNKLNHLVTMSNESRTKLGKMLKEDMRLFSKEHLAELWRTEIEKVLGDYY